MNNEWSSKNKEMQKLIGKKSTFKDGVNLLLELRDSIFCQITQIVNGYPSEAFWKMPFKGAEGYHSKSLAYSIWHIFRIEDIVAHSLVAGDEQVLFSDDWLKKTGSGIITTGNELSGDEIEAFSRTLNVEGLYGYAEAVKKSADEILRNLSYEDSKRTFGQEHKDRIFGSGCVDHGEAAVWLIDYWCGKNVAGLIKMPFSRHWIMHVEAMCRIKNRLCLLARKGVDPVAYCGFSCNHCFLGEWCGGCRTEYNCCSFATCSADKKCPNAKCCQEKNLDGCYECADLKKCTKGFYTPENDGAEAAKAQSMFVAKYGKKNFLKLHDMLHKKYEFAKTQEILGQNAEKGFALLESVWLKTDSN